MIRKILLLYSLIILFSSCTGKEEPQFKEIDFSNPEIIAPYILPSYREELMKEIPYGNIYRLFINIDREKKQVSATCKLSYFNNSGVDLKEIQFRLLMNSPDNKHMIIHSAEADDIPVLFSLSEDNTTLSVPMEKKLIHGKRIELNISYAIDFTEDPAYYFDFARIDKQGFSIPHFFPVVSRNIKGVWENDPLVSGGDLLSADSAWFMVEIETDDDVVLVTSGIEISGESRGGRQKRAYAAGPVRDFFICGDEEFIPRVTLSGDTKVISYSRGEIHDSSAMAAGFTSSALSLFSSSFVKYPYKELKIVGLPMSALGIEFSGIFAIQEDLYYEPVGNYFESTIVHEAAHQWFYSILGNNQLRDPWIDEGLTQYALWLYYRENYGPSAALGLFNSFIERWERVNREKIPINKEVSFYFDKEYSSIIYGRAPLFLIELRNTLGEKQFDLFVRHLINRYYFKQIDTDTFIAELEEFTGLSSDPLLGDYFD